MATKKNTVNSEESRKKRNANLKPWPKGTSGNPKGAPRRGESWAEIIKRVGEMTPVEAADHAQLIAGQLRGMGGTLTLKEAVVLRVYAALLFDPTSSLLNTFMERAEGKIVNPVDVTTNGESVNVTIAYVETERTD